MTKALLLALSGLVAACGGPGGGGPGADWVKPGADSAVIEREYRDCADLADTAMAKDRAIDQDIAATRGADAQRGGAVQAGIGQMQDKTRHSAESIIAACMQQKGFHERR